MQKNAPTFEKELLSETVITKVGKKGKQTFPITPDFLKNCVVQYQRMQKSGVKVNVHSGHEHTPETKRGEVLDLYVKKHKDGRVGLFGKIAFLPHLPKEMIQTLISNDVSVELHQELYDAKGNLYLFPVRRVAITPDPAVSGMQPFVQQRDTSVNAPFLTLSIDTLNKENNSMGNDLLDNNDDSQNDVINQDADTSGEETDTGLDDVNDTSNVACSKNKGSFIDSSLAKVLFDLCGIDPDDYDDEEGLIDDLNQHLTNIITLQNRALAALQIDEDDPNRYELFTEKLEYLVNLLENYDENDDGMLDDGEAKDALENQDGGGDGNSDTIDESISNLEQKDKSLQLSLNNLQTKHNEALGTIKALVAKNRQLELDGMLQTGVLTKAAHHKATQKFVLKLSLNDGFDDFVEVSRVNARTTGHSKTPIQRQTTKTDTGESWVTTGKRIAATYRRDSDKK